MDCHINMHHQLMVMGNLNAQILLGHTHQWQFTFNQTLTPFLIAALMAIRCPMSLSMRVLFQEIGALAMVKIVMRRMIA
jgi:hypothetical protein